MEDATLIPQVNPWLGEAEAEAAFKAVASNWLSEGPLCAKFSEQLNELIGSPYGVFAPNGTQALILGLLALDIAPGDEVLVPDITFIGSANAVVMLGAKPVFVDVDPQTYQIDLAHAEVLVTSRTKAIMPVHLYGTACNMDAVSAFSSRHKLRTIEDAAQGIGVQYKDQHVGSFGDVGCFSFFADKTITTGEGGYVVCRNQDIYEKLRFLRNQGRLHSGTFVHPHIGFNFRITEMQAAIGIVQLAKLPEIIRRKRQIFSWYQASLAHLKQVTLLASAPNSTHVPFRCVLISPAANALMEFLAKNNVQSRGFFYPMHRQPCFRDIVPSGALTEVSDSRYPNADYGFAHGLCLPVFPTLAKDDVLRITTLIDDFWSR